MHLKNFCFCLVLVFSLSGCEGKTGSSDDASTASSPAVYEEKTFYECEDVSVKATYSGGDSLTVEFDGKSFAMKPEPAASGAKYSDSEGNTFWTKGSSSGLLLLKGQKDRRCVVAD
ncbi:MliC family protein [Stenotrophomonas maltophilia]